MKTIITSDVHLGNGHCRVNAFREFVIRLRSDVRLVLNGDVIDDPLQVLEGAHLETLGVLIDRYGSGDVVWVRGNHDEGFEAKAAIEQRNDFAIEDRLYVCHGDRFDNVMPYNRWFLKLFSLLHRIRIVLGAHAVHVAQFAKRFGFLYGFLRRNVMMNAIEHAKERGVTAVACGHVHYAERREKDGVVYFNLGAWTEEPNHCLLVDDDGMELVTVDEAMKRPEWFIEKQDEDASP